MSAQPKTIESLADLSPDARNVNRGTEIGAKTIEESLRTFGAGRSIVADRNGVVIAGNKTLENAAKAGIDKIRVVPTIGDELVVVQRLDLDLERDSLARGLALSDNRASEVSYSPDDALLAQMLTELAEQDKATAQATGYDDAAIRALVESVARDERAANPVEDKGPQIDRAQELQEKWAVKRGDLWAIGRHKLLCGDSTNAEDVARLMDGQKAQLFVSDPPYNVNVAGGTKDPRDEKNYRHLNSIDNDDMSLDEFYDFLLRAFQCADASMSDGACYYIAHADVYAYEFIGAVRAVGWRQARPSVVQWVKESIVFGRGDYHSQSEPMLYGWKQGAAHHAVTDRTQSNVWNIARPSSTEEHPTMKPVELFTRAITNSSKADSIVYDAFLGSGTTMVAAEQTGRICYGMEVEQKYCAVTLERLSAMGLTPRLA